MDSESYNESLEGLFFEKSETPLELIESYVSSNGKEFFFSLKSVDTIPSGLYNLVYNQNSGYGVSVLPYSKEDYIILPSSIHVDVLEGIKKFWSNKEIFIKYGLTPKRGIILYGDPGNGKTSCIYLLVEEVKKQNGLAVYFNNPENWIEVAKMIRKIEKERPILCIIEDLDLVIAKYGEEVFLNFLDGLNSVDNVVYVATTNDINGISDRIKHRPSRFDELFEIKKPTDADRLFYFNAIIKDDDKELYNIEKLAKDTAKFSMAHLRETFVSLYIMKSDYKKTIDRLKRKKISESPLIGFGLDD